MSGKKDWEVADLLEEGIKARKRTESNLNNAIGSNTKLIHKAGEELAKTKGTVKAVQALNNEAGIMFGNKGKEIVQKAQSAQQKLADLGSPQEKLLALQAEIKRIDLELQKCDNEGNEIRKIISRKSGYLDKEYAQAKRLKQKYESWAQQRNDIARKINELAAMAQANASEAKALARQINKYGEAISDMNQTAKNKADADALKSKLSQIMNGVEVKWAQKFLNEDYRKLKKSVEDIIGKNDVVVLKEGPAVLSTVNEFVAKLVELKTGYEKAMQDADNLREQAETLTRSGYVDPVDFRKNGEKAKQIHLFAYLKKYRDTPYEAEFEKLMEAAAEAEEQDTTEGYIKAQELYKKAYAKAEEGRNYALNLQEQMIKGDQMAAAIDSVMYFDLKYNVESTLINGNSADGFRVVCSSGGEKITFDIKYDKDGKPRITLDHKESIGGTCKHSMEGIAKAMRSKGITLIDITKNGKTILGPEVTIGTVVQEPGNRERTRG